MRLRCPLCGRDMIVDVAPNEGQHVVCVNCEGGFDYKKEYTIVESRPIGLHTVNCPHCGKAQVVNKSRFGERLRCSGCNRTFALSDPRRRQAPSRIVLRRKVGSGVDTQQDSSSKDAGFLMKLWSSLAEFVGGLIGLLILVIVVVALGRYYPDIRDYIVQAIGSGNWQKFVASSNKGDESMQFSPLFEPDMNGMFGVRFGSIWPSDDVETCADGTLKSSSIQLKNSMLCFSQYKVTILPVSRRVCSILSWCLFPNSELANAEEYFKIVVKLLSQKCATRPRMRDDGRKATFWIGEEKCFMVWYRIEPEAGVVLYLMGVDAVLDDQKRSESREDLNSETMRSGQVWKYNGDPLDNYLLGTYKETRQEDFIISGFLGFQSMKITYTSKGRIACICLKAEDSAQLSPSQTNHIVTRMMKRCDLKYGPIDWTVRQQYSGGNYAKGRCFKNGKVDKIFVLIPTGTGGIEAMLISARAQREDDGYEYPDGMYEMQ